MHRFVIGAIVDQKSKACFVSLYEITDILLLYYIVIEMKKKNEILRILRKLGTLDLSAWLHAMFVKYKPCALLLLLIQLKYTLENYTYNLVRKK